MGTRMAEWTDGRAGGRMDARAGEWTDGRMGVMATPSWKDLPNITHSRTDTRWTDSEPSRR